MLGKNSGVAKKLVTKIQILLCGTSWRSAVQYKSTKWVASSFRTVSVVWHSFAFLYNNFFRIKNDKSRSPTEQAMYSGLIRRLSSSEFLMNLAIMYDILAEIAFLSERSTEQKHDLIAYTDKLIRKCITFIGNLKEKSSTKCRDARLLRKVIFVTLPLLKTLRYQPSTHNNFGPVNELKFMSVSVHTNSKQEQYDTLLKELKVLEGDKWPSEKPPGFGEIEIERAPKIQINCLKD
ncbi:hypothetical protein PR048_027509 [Dryococelus australis]|uniref:Uncharacterized protein n=1 Tax=Dryococelus australis TaxID=614101 RepID=A0ABQ9GGQ3_9NEOP|nr:hypothetical protein PR048_027509 [Dryococelus australis]